MDINPVRQESLRQQKEAHAITTERTAQHTAGATWRQKDSTQVYAQGRHVADCGSRNTNELPLHIGLEDAANAEFICRACNSHDGLVAALKDMLSIADSTHGAQARTEKARAILKAATGEK